MCNFYLSLVPQVNFMHDTNWINNNIGAIDRKYLSVFNKDGSIKMSVIHMDKIKGEGVGGGGKWVWLGGVEGWGENADNYNWITIKN